VVLRFSLVVFCVYRVHGTTKKEFVANVVHAKMQCCHLYIARHATRATNATIKHKIIDNDMV
jgi:hypothetical protein